MPNPLVPEEDGGGCNDPRRVSAHPHNEQGTLPPRFVANTTTSSEQELPTNLTYKDLGRDHTSIIRAPQQPSTAASSGQDLPSNIEYKDLGRDHTSIVQAAQQHPRSRGVDISLGGEPVERAVEQSRATVFPIALEAEPVDQTLEERLHILESILARSPQAIIVDDNQPNAPGGEISTTGGFWGNRKRNYIISASIVFIVAVGALVGFLVGGALDSSSKASDSMLPPDETPAPTMLSTSKDTASMTTAPDSLWETSPPAIIPTTEPTSPPVLQTTNPSISHTLPPTLAPTFSATSLPTAIATLFPTMHPTTSSPTLSPTHAITSPCRAPLLKVGESVQSSTLDAELVVNATLHSCLAFYNTDYSPAKWFRIKGTGGRIQLSTCSEFTQFTTALAVFSGNSCESLTTCVGQSSGVGSDTTDPACMEFSAFYSAVNFQTTADVDYYILLYGQYGGTGDFELRSQVALRCIQNRQELLDAVDRYLLDNSPTTIDAGVYGWPIGTWCIDGVTDMYSIFDASRNVAAEQFNESLSGWDVSLVEDMFSMFWGASSFDRDLSMWDTSRVQTMLSMFSGAASFNQPLNSWNTSSCTNMGRMFSRAASFNQPLSLWNVERVTDLSAMFTGASLFNQDLSDWSVSSVSDFYSMFWEASAFNQDLCAWGDLVQGTARVEAMFEDSSCPAVADPDLGVNPRGPFCSVCS